MPEEKSLLNIGIVLPQFPSYTETFFINKIMGLRERGYNITLFCGSLPTEEALESTGLKNFGLTIVSLNFSLSALKSPAKFINYIFIVLKSLHTSIPIFKKRLYNNFCLYIFKKHSCEVYHFGYSGSAINHIPLFNSLPGKTMVSCLGTAENIKAITEVGRMEQLHELFSTTDKIHCVSENMAETVQGYGAAPEKIFVNRPAIDIDFFSREKPYLSNGTIHIFSAGRMVFQKGFVIGLFAINELKKKFPQFIWKIAGDGPKMEELLLHIHILGLTEHVKLIGKKNKNEMHALYEEADIFFLPSVSEGLANVALEAMAMALPVVASDAGGMSEAITNNKNGMINCTYDYVSMANQLFELCSDFETRQQLGKQARKKIEEQFFLKRYIDVFEQEYIKLAQQS